MRHRRGRHADSFTACGVRVSKNALEAVRESQGDAAWGHAAYKGVGKAVNAENQMTRAHFASGPFTLKFDSSEGGLLTAEGTSLSALCRKFGDVSGPFP